MPKYKVSDTITLERTWIVEAKSEYGAIDQIDGLSRPAPDPDEEEQIDNTPYEAERIDGETCPACRDELHGEPVDDATIATMCEPCQAIARENAAEDAAEGARVPTCDMVRDCREPVTHIDTRGFAYCTAHGLERRDSQPCRKLRAHERRRLERGEQVTKY